MSHYFTYDKNLPADEIVVPYAFAGESFRFVSRAGIFAKGQADENSRLLLQSLPPLRGRLCDLGCGFGLLGVVLGKVYGLDVLCTDINPLAAELAGINLAAHGVTGKAAAADGLFGVTEQFNTVVMNPPIHAGKTTVFRLYQEARDHLVPGGYLYVVILKKHGAESTRVKLMDIFGNCETIYRKKGVFVFRGVTQTARSANPSHG